MLISVIEKCFPQVKASDLRPNCSLRRDLNFDDEQMALLSSHIQNIFGVLDIDLNRYETIEKLCEYIENNT